MTYEIIKAKLALQLSGTPYITPHGFYRIDLECRPYGEHNMPLELGEHTFEAVYYTKDKYCKFTPGESWESPIEQVNRAGLMKLIMPRKVIKHGTE